MDKEPAEPCPSCGARLGGRAGCQAMFEQLSAAAWTGPGRASMHTLVVDTYAMQHPDDYCRSAKSYAAHLIALCCGVEEPRDQALYWTVPRWLDGPATLEKPPLIAHRARVTIADMEAASDESDYVEGVSRWARDVWTTYAEQHELARQWLGAVRAHKIRAGTHVKR